jgi:hypothetical protein
LTPDSSLNLSKTNTEERKPEIHSRDEDFDKVDVYEKYIDEDYDDQTSICGCAENEHAFNHFMSEINEDLSNQEAKQNEKLSRTLSLVLPTDGTFLPNWVYRFEDLQSRPRGLSSSDPQLHLHQNHRHTSSWHRRYKRLKDWMGRLNPFKKKH